jgi:hypothetical protein
MPLLSPASEFADKWKILCAAHVAEGIREPVKLYEYRNRFYVEEGNKRVSVLKYFGAPTIPAVVTRYVPKRSESPENRVYFEFLDFYAKCPVNYLIFSKPGSYRAFTEAAGKQPDDIWTDEERMNLKAMYSRFTQALQMARGTAILRTALWVIGLFTLLSGIVGVSNIMLITVRERTREFGIRKAIGATPARILRIIITESVLVTAFFGYIGMLLGIFFCEWMDATVGNQVMDVGIFQARYFVDPTVDLHTCVQATIVIIVAGALAGFFPARKAVKVKAIDALRSA